MSKIEYTDGLTGPIGAEFYADCRAKAVWSMQVSSNAIKYAANVTSSPSYDLLVQTLVGRTAKTIITGVGKSAICARKMSATLATCGTPAVFVDPLDLYHGELGMILSEDLVILISHSGETDELTRLLPALQAKGCQIFSIVSSGHSTIGRATTSLVTGVTHEPFLKIPTASCAAVMAIGDALAIEVALRNGYGHPDLAENHPGGATGVAYRQG